MPDTKQDAPNPAAAANLAALSNPENDMDTVSAWNNVKQIVHAYRGANFKEHEWIKKSIETMFNRLVLCENLEKDIAEVAMATVETKRCSVCVDSRGRRYISGVIADPDLVLPADRECQALVLNMGNDTFYVLAQPELIQIQDAETLDTLASGELRKRVVGKLTDEELATLGISDTKQDAPNPAAAANLAALSNPENDMDTVSAWNNVKQIVHAYRGANFEEHEWIEKSIETVFNRLVLCENLEKDIAQLKETLQVDREEGHTANGQPETQA